MDLMGLLNLYLPLVAAVLPIVVAAVTKSKASSSVKGWTLAVLSGLAALVAEVMERYVLGGVSFSWQEVFNNLLLTFATAVILYKGGIVKAPTLAVAQATANSGIGGKAKRRSRRAPT